MARTVYSDSKQRRIRENHTARKVVKYLFALALLLPHLIRNGVDFVMEYIRRNDMENNFHAFIE